MSGIGLVQPMSRISNRTLIEKMKAWGWEVRKVDGEITVMGNRRMKPQKSIEVWSAHHHARNSGHDINAMLGMMGMTWEHFMTKAPAPIEQKQLLEAVVAISLGSYEAELSEAYETNRCFDRKKDKAVRAEARAEAMLGREPEVPEDKPVPVVTDTPTPVVPLVTGRPTITNHVFDLMVDKGQPASVQAIAKMSGHTVAQVTAACKNLYNAGVFDRMKRGVYQVKPQFHRQDVMIQVSGHDKPRVDQPPAPVLPQPEIAVQQPTVAPAAPVPAPAADPTDDGVINDLLDLMFPSGFKARHLPAIEAWKAATRTLMTAVGDA